MNHYALGPGSTGPTRHHGLAKHLPEHGWEMHLVAASVEHATGRQRLSAVERIRPERLDGVPFLWIRTPDYRGNGFDRLLNMLSFTVGVLHPRTGRALPRPDIVIGSSLHPLGAWAGAVLARRHRVPFVFEFRDLWPETLIAMGRLSENGPAATAIRILEGSLCRRASHIFTPIPNAGTRIEGLGVSRDRLTWVANGVDIDALPARKTVRRHSRPFTLMYLGAHGVANDLDTLLEAMTLLKDQGLADRILCRLVGDGPEKPRLTACARERGLGNMCFEPPVPKTAVPALAEEADAFVICVRDLPALYRYGICMNKLCDYMVMGRPTVAALEAANNPIAESGGGLTVPPERPGALAEAIVALATLPPESREAMGRRAREHVERHLSCRAIAATLAGVLDAASSSPVRC